MADSFPRFTHQTENVSAFDAWQMSILDPLRWLICGILCNLWIRRKRSNIFKSKGSHPSDVTSQVESKVITFVSPHLGNVALQTRQFDHPVWMVCSSERSTCWVTPVWGQVDSTALLLTSTQRNCVRSDELYINRGVNSLIYLPFTFDLDTWGNILCSTEEPGALDQNLNMLVRWISIMRIDDRIDGVEIA